MAQNNGYNQYAGYGQMPGQSRSMLTGNQNQQQYPSGTFQGQPATYGAAPDGGPQYAGQASASGSGANSNASTIAASQPSAGQPAAQGAAGQMTSSEGPMNGSPSQATATSGPQQSGSWIPRQQVTPSMMGDPSGGMQTQNQQNGGGYAALSQASTGPTNMDPGQPGAAGAWSNGYNPTVQQQPPMIPTRPDWQRPAQQGALAAQSVAPPPPPSPPPSAPAASASPTVGTADWFNGLSPAQQSAYGQGASAGGTADSKAQAAAMQYYIQNGQSASNPTGIANSWNDQQQQFTANNPLYGGASGGTGYWGNAAQVGAQQAEGAQANSIPTGVLGTSFGRGGADYGGTQTAQNMATGNNGATNWTGSTYGLPAASAQGPMNGNASQQSAVTGAQQGGSYAGLQQVTPGMMMQGTGTITANAQQYPAGTFQGAQAGISPYALRQVTPEMMIQPGAGTVTQNAQRIGPGSVRAS